MEILRGQEELRGVSQAMEKIENGKVNPTISSLYLIAISLKTDLEDIVKLK